MTNKIAERITQIIPTDGKWYAKFYDANPGHPAGFYDSLRILAWGLRSDGTVVGLVAGVPNVVPVDETIEDFWGYEAE